MIDLQRYTIQSHEGYARVEEIEDDRGEWVKAGEAGELIQKLLADNMEFRRRVALAYADLRELWAEHKDDDAEYPDWQDKCEELGLGSFFSALDFALTGGTGCLDQEEMDKKRDEAMAKFGAELGLAVEVSS